MILSEKHEMMRRLFRQFAETEFTDDILEELEATGEFNWEMHRKMAANGFLGTKIPVEYGGQGGDSLAYVLMVEEFARVSPVLSLYANTSNSLGAGPLLFCGTDAQKEKYVTPIARGEKILVFALTEPGAGSDAGSTLTTAVEDGDFYILNGRKTFISGAPFADYAVVYARTDAAQKGSKGLSMFILDMKLPGVSVGKHENKMGIIGYPTSDIIMEDVRVHKSDLLGPLHRGFSTAMKTLDGGRLGVAAQSLGIAQGCLEELVYNTAVMKDAGSPDGAKRCAMSKLFASEMCNRVAYKAVQIHGGYGYIKEYKVERFYRDARITTLYEGTSQVQQMVISGSLLR